ncbi:zinc-binding dehydrogenase [Streptomyces sp. 8N706]|uniref:zinc-binding dehydrogenase n=1 Tax=Streptomyces sp. 8N706 TaxID=3457416 RepID=UPI003FD0D67B
MARFATAHADVYERHRRELSELSATGRIRTAVHAELPLEEASKAHETVESRANPGKVVLRTS